MAGRMSTMLSEWCSTLVRMYSCGAGPLCFLMRPANKPFAFLIAVYCSSAVRRCFLGRGRPTTTMYFQYYCTAHDIMIIIYIYLYIYTYMYIFESTCRHVTYDMDLTHARTPRRICGLANRLSATPPVRTYTSDGRFTEKRKKKPYTYLK